MADGASHVSQDSDIVFTCTTGISFYLYFLVTQREFAYRDWKEQTMARLQVGAC